MVLLPDPNPAPLGAYDVALGPEYKCGDCSHLPPCVGANLTPYAALASGVLRKVTVNRNAMQANRNGYGPYPSVAVKDVELGNTRYYHAIQILGPVAMSFDGQNTCAETRAEIRGYMDPLGRLSPPPNEC